MRHSAITAFIQNHFRHFNARVLRDAADGYKRHLEAGGQMLVALGGAMSTAEIGVSMAQMIRAGHIHAVSCTGANLEEDLFNLVAHKHYKRVANHRSIGPPDDAALLAGEFNRVTDTCIPDSLIWARLERPFMEAWQKADRNGERLFPYEFVFSVLRDRSLERHYEIDPEESWLLAAMDKGVPIFVPAWEDSSLGNMYAAACMRRDIKNVGTARSGIEVMTALADWYSLTATRASLGFFQVGGGVAGDFAICVVPMLHTDLLRSDLPRWRYFCQVGDSVTSYG
jgi:deoxyhypusine synthase